MTNFVNLLMNYMYIHYDQYIDAKIDNKIISFNIIKNTLLNNGLVPYGINLYLY